jgi:GAF domain-containing protein
MTTDPHQVTDTLVALADTLVHDYDLLDYLDRLLQCTTGVIGADAGGVMLAAQDGDARLQVLSSTSESMRMLELFELQRQEGPCIDCHVLGEQVIVEDLEASRRWPMFAPLALERGYRSVYALPLRLRGVTIGALNLFRVEPGPVAAEHLRAAQAFADMATIGIMQQRAVHESRELAGQLQLALHSRVVIEQAKGLLAERLACELDQAYQLIRWYGRNNNRRLREVAAEVVAGTLSAGELNADPAGGS